VPSAIRADGGYGPVLRRHRQIVSPPVQVQDVERLLAVTLPARLRRVYEESDGRWSDLGQWWVVWQLDRLVEDNERAWADGTLPRHLLAFGDDGTGNPFCVALNSDADEVLRWNFIDLDVEVSEGTMDDFARAWLDRG
jgi:hypothetical protein